ncbi:MAG TPA: hypothetical protein VF761_08075 [Gemmatimonadaceae bacterium]
MTTGVQPATARGLAPGASPMGATPAPSSIALAGEHFAAATLYLVVGALGLVWIAPELAAGAYASPHVAGVTHLFTLGWLTTTIFGALYQLLPVALGAPLRSVRVGHVGFAAFAPGAGLFAAGVATGSATLSHAGIVLITIGVALAVSNIASSLPRARSRDVTWAAVATALTFLASTLVLGVVLLHNLHTGFLAEARVRVLATHLHVALVGWALVMMVGVSHRLLPMFLLAHGADTAWTRRSLLLLATGVVALAIAVTSRDGVSGWVAVAMLEGGVACFVWQARSFHRARVRRKIDVGMRFAAIALGFLVAAALLGIAVFAAGASHARLATAYVAVGLLGGIVLYVVGFFYKIVPLLAWTVRYRERMGRGDTPTVAQTFSARIAHEQLVVMTAGVSFLAVGIGGGSAHATRCGAVFFLAGVLLFVSQIARVSIGAADAG